MQTQNRLLDDLARLTTSALGTLKDARTEFEERLREQVERVLGRMDLVTREEFSAVKAMAACARTENEALARSMAALEKRVRRKKRKAPEPPRADDPAAPA